MELMAGMEVVVQFLAPALLTLEAVVVGLTLERLGLMELVAQEEVAAAAQVVMVGVLLLPVLPEPLILVVVVVVLAQAMAAAQTQAAAAALA